MELYQFPISHFSEKARWALDHKGIDYEVKDLVPGLHLFTARRRGWPKTHVPVLRAGDVETQGSGAIIDYLELISPGRPLTPHDAVLREDAMRLERRIDNNIGRSIQTLGYYGMLEDNERLIRVWSLGARQPSTVLLRMALPGLKIGIRRVYRLTPEGVSKALERLTTVVTALEEQLSDGRRFLLGDTFTRVDIAAAALFAPVVAPVEHQFLYEPNPKTADQVAEFAARPFAAWVRQMYREYRHTSP